MPLVIVKGKFGRPIQDDTFWGGDVKYRDFRVLYNWRQDALKRVSIIGSGVCLHEGITVGSSAHAVNALFPGGFMAYDQYKVTYGPYLLHFSLDRGQVSEIDIEPAFGPFRPLSGGGRETGPAISRAALVGTWHGVATTVGTLVLRADGTYLYGGRTRGRYTLAGRTIKFTGPLVAWNQGRATLDKYGILTFAWTTGSGAKQLFVFAKGS
jgi:hypothetical protein